MDRIIRVTATLQCTCYIVVDVPARKALDAQARCRFGFRAVDVLLTQYARHRLHQYKRLQGSAWNPVINGAVHPVVIQASPMHVEARGIYIHNRGAEQVHAVFVPNARVEAIEASTRLGPIADANHALIPEIEQLSSGEKFEGLIVEFYVGLAKVEVVPHVGGGGLEWESKSIKNA